MNHSAIHRPHLESDLRLAVERGEPRLHYQPRVDLRNDLMEELPALCQRLLAAARLDRKWIELELTESLLMESPEPTIALLHRLDDAGTRLAIDDFGTGYSSLAYLTRLPLSYLKVDRAFVKNVCTDPNSATVARAIVGLAHSLRHEKYQQPDPPRFRFPQ